MKCLSTFILLFVLLQSDAQNLNLARSTGMGNLSTIFSDQNALFNNQAGLASLKKTTAVAGLERRFWWADVNLSGAGLALPTRSGTFGFLAQNFGFSEFSQQKIGLSYARQLWQAIRFGGQIDYYHLSIPEYGNNGVFSFELGLQADLAKDLMIGMHIANPYQVEFTGTEKLATVFQMGLFYKPVKKMAIGMELEKDIDFPMRLKCGLEYLPSDKFTFRTGYSSNPTNFHFGIGLMIQEKLNIDVGSKYDLSLGLASSLSVAYDF